MHSYMGKHPDASYMGKLLDASCVPLFDMMRTWVFEGQLMDPYREFFVASANKGGVRKP
eukprot:gene7205-316_t